MATPEKLETAQVWDTALWTCPNCDHTNDTHRRAYEVIGDVERCDDCRKEYRMEF